jgi:hypothetical protein
MILLPLLSVLLALDSPDAGNTPGQGCPTLGRHEDFSWSVLGPSLAKEPPPPGTEAKRFLADKDSWLRDCPRNELVWYAVLRATELISQDRKAPPELVEAARAAVPGSVWIETVRARTLGTVEAAEAAVRLAPKRIPSQVALAAAYERAGDRQSALRILRSIRDLQRVAGGPLLLARVALALGDAKLAAESARREPGSELGLIEPVSGMLLLGEARALEGDARLKLGQADKAPSHHPLPRSASQPTTSPARSGRALDGQADARLRRQPPLSAPIGRDRTRDKGEPTWDVALAESWIGPSHGVRGLGGLGGRPKPRGTWRGWTLGLGKATQDVAFMNRGVEDGYVREATRPTSSPSRPSLALPRLH